MHFQVEGLSRQHETRLEMGLISENPSPGDVIISLIILALPPECPSPPQHVTASSCSQIPHESLGTSDRAAILLWGVRGGQLCAITGGETPAPKQGQACR